MNVESIISKIRLFEELVIESGFLRDLGDYYNSIQASHNRNLVFMKDLSARVQESLLEFENNSLHSELNIVLKESEPFTSLETLDSLHKLDQDKEVEASTYFSNLNSLIIELRDSITTNEAELDKVSEIFSKYLTTSDQYDSSNAQAILSVVFKDLKSISSLKEFSKALHLWNRTLLIYHSLIKSESPEEIPLLEVQNGSIDVVFNIDMDVAVDLVNLLKVGLKVYGVYLLYKSKVAREIIEVSLGNKKLIKIEQDREKIMLDHIYDSIKTLVIAQHKENLKTDKKIDKTSLNKRVEVVSKVLTDHIIKGNEVKLLAAPQVEEEDNQTPQLAIELRKETSSVKEMFKNLKDEDKQLLLDKYSLKDDTLES